jgi:outer membrane usher protein
MANLSISLGRRLQASASSAIATGRTSAGLGIRQVGSAPGEVNWEAYAGGGPNLRGFAQAGIRTGFGQFGAGLDYAGGTALVRASASGSLVMAAGGLYAANPVRDSFALVEAGGLAEVRVLQDNQVMGRTNRAGRLLLTDLRAFDGNRIQIDAEDLPIDAQVGATELVLRPSERAGMVARFAVRREKSVLLTLVDEQGRPIEVGASARLAGGSAREPVGYDGKLFLEGVSPHNRLRIELSGGRSCALSFDAPPGDGAIPELGPLVCAAAPEPAEDSVKRVFTSLR